jgi:hypothetical protein
MSAFLALVVVLTLSGQAAQTAQPPPQEPTTTIVGADGKLRSLIFLRADAENVTRRVYDALLDRAPTEQEFADSVAELQRGRLPQQLTMITQTKEFTDRTAGLSAAELVDQVFQGMLDRRPSPAEARTYQGQMQARQYSPALLKLITSESFRKQVALDRAASPGSTASAPPTPAPAAAAASSPASPSRPPSMPPPVPAAGAPPSTTVPMSSPALPAPAPASVPAARPPLRPAPFPTARNAPASMPLVAPPSLSAEWTRILACQDQVVSQLRIDPSSPVVLRFDAAEISASSVRGTAVDALDGNRPVSYQCSGGRTTAGYVDARPARPARPGTNFPFAEIQACHAAVTAALGRDRDNPVPSFATAGMMPTDANLFIRGAGSERSRSGQPQPFTYQCQWNGSSIVGATYTFLSR